MRVSCVLFSFLTAFASCSIYLSLQAAFVTDVVFFEDYHDSFLFHRMGPLVFCHILGLSCLNVSADVSVAFARVLARVKRYIRAKRYNCLVLFESCLFWQGSVSHLFPDGVFCLRISLIRPQVMAKVFCVCLAGCALAREEKKSTCF